MILLKGNWYAALSSRQRTAQLQVTGNRYTVFVDGHSRDKGVVETLDISDRTGNILRKITFADGSLLETRDNDAVDELILATGHKASRLDFLHRFESSWKWVASSVVLVLVLGIGFFKWGLPFSARLIAHALPVSVHESVASGSLSILDQLIFEPSELSLQSQQEISQRFAHYIKDMDSGGFEFRLNFRSMSGIPNAMALPSGEIIITDALANLVESPQELDAVLLHEIGHVLKRHSMQHVIQSSTVALILSLAIGDVSGIGELATAIPAFLLQSNYARKSESEADEFAFAEMTRAGIDPEFFATVILKLEQFSDGADVGEQDSEDESTPVDPYLSTHPGFSERAEKARAYSREYFRH